MTPLEGLGREQGMPEHAPQNRDKKENIYSSSGEYPESLVLRVSSTLVTSFQSLTQQDVIVDAQGSRSYSGNREKILVSTLGGHERHGVLLAWSLGSQRPSSQLSVSLG